MKLSLPLPPSPNSLPSHHMALHRAKNDYRRECWTAAIQQKKPDRDPPELVVLIAHFHVMQERDHDNLYSSLKFVCDCLKQKQEGDMHWRQGLYDRCGYFIDDNPSHLRIAMVEQETVSKRNEQRMEVELIEVDSVARGVA